MSEQGGKERRGFFRIDDQVALSYRTVSASEANESTAELKVDGNDAESLANELDKMAEVSRIHFRHVEKDFPEIARYFTHLESKINLIAHHVMMDSDELFVKRTQSVSISGSGIGFTADELLNVGDFIEVRFVLKPTITNIRTFSKVVSCVADNGQFKVAVEFRQLSDDDRDLLIRHVVKKQMNDIRDSSE